MKSAVEHVEQNGELLAIVIRSDFHVDGTAFVTPESSLIQMGYMHHMAGFVVRSHRHLPHKRETTGTCEVLYVKRGHLRAFFFGQLNTCMRTLELSGGDWVVLLGGGHAFEMLEETTIIEIKNGPYAGEQDKVRFKPEDMDAASK